MPNKIHVYCPDDSEVWFTSGESLGEYETLIEGLLDGTIPVPGNDAYMTDELMKIVMPELERFTKPFLIVSLDAEEDRRAFLKSLPYEFHVEPTLAAAAEHQKLMYRYGKNGKEEREKQERKAKFLARRAELDVIYRDWLRMLHNREAAGEKIADWEKIFPFTNEYRDPTIAELCGLTSNPTKKAPLTDDEKETAAILEQLNAAKEAGQITSDSFTNGRYPPFRRRRLRSITQDRDGNIIAEVDIIDGEVDVALVEQRQAEREAIAASLSIDEMTDHQWAIILNKTPEEIKREREARGNNSQG